MLARLSTGFVAPCLPTKAHTLPAGSQWLHEIKHDGFRVTARKDGERVRLYSRPGNELTRRFPPDRRGAGTPAPALCIIDGRL
jgi:bifunctional non-homologous end joining protein LigD